VAPGVHEFGHRQVEPRIGPRAAPHRRAEAGRARLRALYRDDERAIAPSTVDRIDVLPTGQHLVEDADRAHVARAHAEQGVSRSVPALAGHHGAGRAVRRPQPRPRRVEHRLPGLGAGGVSERGGVGSLAQPVPARFGLDPPAKRQLGDRGQLGHDDRAVPHRGADHRIPAIP
jgi:hypothetical protein